VINGNLGPISRCFRDAATYSFLENCGQTAADGDMLTIDSLEKVASQYSTVPSPTLYHLPFSHNTSVTDDDRRQPYHKLDRYLSTVG